MADPIVVVGAGVSGLTCALLLSRNKKNAVTVIAKHMPGDYDIDYASPWAGANVSPMAAESDSRWERETWPELKRLAEEVPEAGIHFQKSQILRRKQDMGQSAYDALFDPNPWFRTLFSDWRELSADELPAPYFSGSEFTSVCINTATYLQWLLGQCLRAGVVVRRGELAHLTEARTLSHTGRDARFVVNCTGLGSLRLGGVEDRKMVPARGQIVLVANECEPMVTVSGTEDGPTEVCYTMTRAGGGGTIIGGTYDKGNWNGTPDPNIAMRIMQRAVDLCPSLGGGKGVAGLDVIRHGVGLRPAREGGLRLELDKSVFGADGPVVVHNYGHAGWGYQGSYGCAEGVVELVSKVRADRGESAD